MDNMIQALNERYILTDRATGEEKSFKEILGEEPKPGFQIGYPELLADYLNVFNTPASRVLAYMLKEKSTDNKIEGSIKVISLRLGVSMDTVSRTLRLLQEKDLIRKVQGGLYMVSPNVLSWGGIKKRKLLDIWRWLDE